MARGRFISSSLGDSERFSSLEEARHQVAFVLIVTWADAEGRFVADPITLNGKLFTRLGWSPDDVAESLNELHRVGLISLYRVDGKLYGVVERFHDHNNIPRKRDGTPVREAASKLPAPPQQQRNDWSTTADDLDSHEPTGAEEPSTDRAATEQPLTTHASTAAHLLHSDRAERYPEGKVEVEVEVEELHMSTSGKSPKPTPDQPQEDEEAPPTLLDLIELWNENRGPLRAVRDIEAALVNADLQRLARSFIKRHAKRGRNGIIDLFTTGIPAVAADFHWQGNRAPIGVRTRDAPPYGIENYLRHVESKAEIATDLQHATESATVTPPSAAMSPEDIAAQAEAAMKGEL